MIPDFNYYNYPKPQDRLPPLSFGSSRARTQWEKLQISVNNIFGFTPSNLFENIVKYEQFINYIQAKGNYKPNKQFLKEVLQMIEDHTFDVDELQSIESSFLNLSLFAGSKVSIVKNTVLFEKQIKKMGCSIEFEGERNKSTTIPTLVELCINFLEKNGYPHKTIDTKVWKKNQNL